MLIGIPKERQPEQTRVAGTPDTVEKLRKLGYDVCVEAGAGVKANYFDDQYEKAGAKIVGREEAWRADIVVTLDIPPEAEMALIRRGATIISRFNPGIHPDIVEKLGEMGVTAISMDAAPRISRAQSLDVRSSMANLSGYRAVIEAANEYGRTLGGQMTAAGKVNPAKVYIIGVGVSGLAAIGTADSMGAEVFATDVRPEVADQVESLGGTFVEIPVKQESSDGYAREMTAEEQALVLDVYAEQAAKSDIVITTAMVPGRPAPLLLTEDAIRGMKPGSVIVDLGASDLGGNTALTKAGEVVRTENGVTIIGYQVLPNRMPSQASQLYGQNVVNFFKLVTPDKAGKLVLDEEDEVIRSMTVAIDGNIMWPPPPVKVSAAPTPTPAQAQASAAVKGGSSVAEEENKPAWKKWWWKILLGILGVALILCAPAEMQSHFIVFELAVVIGFYVITNVTHTLHTPLMSVTNAISGIIIVGAVLQIGSANPVVATLSFIAMVIASINIFGGFLVTHRMLKMFQRSSEE